MRCCTVLIDGVMEPLPFGRTIITDFYDGPTEGFTECSECGAVYAFRKVDWDDSQDVRVFAFAPLEISLDAIAARLGVSVTKGKPYALVPPLGDSNKLFVHDLLATLPRWVAALEGWPGKSSVWRDISGLAPRSVSDWFSFLGLPRK